MKNRILLTIISFVLLISCNVSDPAENNKIYQLFDGLRKEIWNEVGAPNNFGLAEGYNYNYSELPKSGKAEHETWAGWYWATYKDAINYKWAGESSDSPTSKYAKAFGIDSKALEDAVSKRSGIDSQSRNKACTENSDCTDLENGSVCAKRSGEEKGYCIPTWFGQCHAWAPAAVMEVEPKFPVEVNGVTFEPQDIKALLTYVYNNVRTEFLGARCNVDEKKIKFDTNGRPSNIECRDLNPGAMHVILTNWLGIHKKSFIEDRTFDDEVWNQPVRGFKVYADNEISKKQAKKLVGDGTYFDQKAVTFRYLITDVNYITESRPTDNGNLDEDRYTVSDRLSYILELDDDGKIIGGEWLNQKLHPDFFWVPTATAGDFYIGNYTFEYAKIKKILQKSLGESNESNVIPNGDFENWNDRKLSDWRISKKKRSLLQGVQTNDSIKIRLVNSDSKHKKLVTKPIDLSPGLYKCSAEVSGNGYIRFGYQTVGSTSGKFRTFAEFGSNGEILDYTINISQKIKKFQLILSVKETSGNHLLVDNVSCIKQ